MTTARPDAPPAFHVMTKPRGAICNLDCKYCYYLIKEGLYAGSQFRMSDEILENYVRQYIEAQQTSEVTFAWQGGEPTLMGLDFFQRAVDLQQKYRRPGMGIHNTLQTNAVTLDDEWCRFFANHGFLIGVSLDGPQALHDAYRVDKGNRPTFQRVMDGIELLKQHGAEYNILTTVHAANADHPLEVYRFLRDDVRARFMQFIPIVERQNETGFQEGNTVTERSVGARQYGDFLIAVFDEWVRNDVGRVFVQLFDVALNAWLGLPAGLCIFDETCGNALALEHNGDLYACDHFVEPNYKLGNIQDDLMIELVASDKQRKFGADKRDTLPDYCRQCDVRFVCNGGCPKNRFTTTPSDQPGLNYLCPGYKAFFTHIGEPMQFMASALRSQRSPADVMAYMKEKDSQKLKQRFASAGRNDPCPCGSGKKFKRCHGRGGRVA
ncbi:MAG TPA: anaerobic sulfatase maturase [Candidatus Sulfomarinibacteraceae bacterium]|nr:anaerobic sulfatase maturase [Candidatus Sulfomarinibacteraceae bacterium]